MKSKTLVLGVLAALLLVFGGGAWFYQRWQADQAAQRAQANLQVLVRAHAPVFGNPQAPVHIVEFFDPACGTCREFYPMVKNLMDAYPGKVKLSLRYAPFHPGSDGVVRLLEAARRQGQFQTALQTLFASQGVWVQNHTAQFDLAVAQLAPLGLDTARLQADMANAEVAQLIAQDLADAKTLGVTMTPEYFINGKPLPSFGFEQLRDLVVGAVAASNP